MLKNSMLESFVLFALFFSQAVYPQQPGDQSARVVRGHVAPPAIGTFTNGRFHHTLTGTEFNLPDGWTITFQGKSSGGGEQIAFALADGSSDPVVQAFVWMKSDLHTADEIPGELRSSVDYKAGMREGQGIPGYKMLKQTIEPRTVGGQSALSAEALFDQGGKMTEYNTWVISEKTRIYVSARTPTADYASLRARIDHILDSFLVP